MRNDCRTAQARRHGWPRRVLVFLGEVALGGLLGAAITVVEDHVAADRLGRRGGVPRLP